MTNNISRNHAVAAMPTMDDAMPGMDHGAAAPADGAAPVEAPVESPAAPPAVAAKPQASPLLKWGGMGLIGLGGAAVLGSIPLHSVGSKVSSPLLFAGLGAALVGIGTASAWRMRTDSLQRAAAPGERPAGGNTSTSTATIPPTVTGVTDPAAAPGGPKVEMQTVAKDLGQLTQVTSAPGDATGLWLVDKSGKLMRRDAAGKVETKLDISSIVDGGGERGLLSVAFHPNYANNGSLFVYYTDKDGNNHVASAHAGAGGKVDKASLTDLMVIDHPDAANHNGGQLQFGPDGMLYIGTGDGGGGDDPHNNSQNLGQRLGKIMRVDVDHP
ncbi:MAG: hypothetical protein JWM98_807, partial [Thermoleophilia bacterium]|nr:hypothetical protein [Thermoleophilia bacterium]